MILIYKTIPAKKIRQEATESISEIVKWFAANSSRTDCTVKLWYGEFITIKRGTQASIAKAVNNAAAAAINHK